MRLNEHRRTVQGISAAADSVARAMDRKRLLMHVLQLRGHTKLAQAASRQMKAYQARLDELQNAHVEAVKVWCRAHLEKLLEQIPECPRDSLDQESAPRPSSQLNVGEIFGLMVDAEAQAKIPTINDDSDPQPEGLQ